VIQFLDSAYPPTVAQVKAALSQGITAWAFYLAGPGAFHNWTNAEVDVLRQGGLAFGLPIWVPAIDLSGDPVADAQSFAAAIRAAGVGPVGALDTEASMRGNPRLVPYVDGFVDELRREGVTQVVYGGGNYMPSGVAPWWIKPGGGTIPAGGALQTGGGNVAGLSVDNDAADTTFPFASLNPERQPRPSPGPAPYGIGDAMHVIPVSFTTNAAGWMAIDCPLPEGAGPHNVVSIVCDWATAYDPQGWQGCVGSVDFAGSKPGVCRLGFKSTSPNQFFTARVFVSV
jgi:hypothetical protein